MDEDDKQTVVEETDEQSQTATEAPDAQDDDLDSLLSQYDAESTPEKPEQGDDDKKVDLDTVHQEITEWRQEQARAEFQKDMSHVVTNVRGELDPDTFDDTMVEAWIDAQARKDPRLSKAWQDRKSNPKQFEKVVGQLGRSFQKVFSQLPDKNLTEDREAVANAVRGASKQAPTDNEISHADVRKMSGPEYESWKQQQFKKAKD